MQTLLLVLALSAATPAADSAPSFEIRPYLHVRPNQGLFLGWVYEGDAPTAVDVRFTVRGAPAQTVTAERRAGVHLVRVPWACDLPAGASYKVPGMRDPIEMARLPCARDAASVRAVFLTDTQQDVELVKKAVDLVKDKDPDLVIHGGDMVQVGGFDDQWPPLLEALHPLISRAPLVVAVGNHEFFWDEDGTNIGRFFGVTPPWSWYRTRVGPLQLVMMDSTHVEDRGVVERQNAFVKASLQKDAPWQAVVFHHALFSKGIAHAPWAPGKLHEFIRATLMPDFEAAGVDVVLNGHTHLFERSRKDGIEYVVGGPTGGMMGVFGGENPYSLRSEKTRTISVVDATPDRLEVQTLDFDGRVIDRVEKLRAGVKRVAGVAAGPRTQAHVRP